MSDDRVKKAADPARTDRAMIDRAVTESREFTDADRLQMLRDRLSNSSLPDLPKISGYHNIWLTTTNSKDTIQSRIRQGYEPITPADIPGWDHAFAKSGETAGLVTVNEMVAFKLPMHLYEMFMKEVHHDEPMRQEEAIKAQADRLVQQASGGGAVSRVEIGDGTAGLARRVEPAGFEA